MCIFTYYLLILKPFWHHCDCNDDHIWVYTWLKQAFERWMSEGLSLTHWGWVTHICVSKLTIIASDNGLLPGRRQAIIWTSAGILLIGPLGTNFSEILFAITTFSFKKMSLKVTSAKWRPYCLCLNVLMVFLGHHGPCNPYKLCNHSLYTGIIIFSHIDNPQSTGNN